MPAARDSASIRYTNASIFTVAIHPTHPALRRRNVRYALFGDPVQNPQTQDLELITASPGNRFWIYRILTGDLPNNLAQMQTE